MSESLGKILIIRGGAIGDFILTLPVLSALREQFPEVRLELLGYPRVAQLALAGNLVHHVQSIEARPLASFFAKGGTLPPELAKYFESFAMVISFLFDPDRIFQENVARCSKAQFIAGPHRPKEGGGVHATDVFLQPLTRLAIFEADPVPRLRIRAPDGGFAGAVPSLNGPRWVAVHPGSGSERKNWPEENWAKLLRLIVEQTSWNVLMVGGEAEGTRLERLANEVPAFRLRVARSLPLTDLAVLLQRCSAFLGHDSGISHLAAAVGLPGLVLWGDTDQVVWRPRSEWVGVLHSSAGLETLDVETVASAALTLLAEADHEGADATG